GRSNTRCSRVWACLPSPLFRKPQASTRTSRPGYGRAEGDRDWFRIASGSLCLTNIRLKKMYSLSLSILTEPAEYSSPPFLLPPPLPKQVCVEFRIAAGLPQHARRAQGIFYFEKT